LLESFPPAKRGQAMALFALGVVVAPVLGPTLGGWLTDQYSWRWAFYINIPVGILAFLMVSRFVKDPPYIANATPGRFDAIGLGLLALWVGTLQIILDKGQEDDWFSATWIRWAVIIVLIGLAGFLVRELHSRHPVVDLHVFKDRNFTLGCIIIGAFGALIYGLVTLLPLFYQTLMGYPASVAGLAVSPRGIGAIMIMPIVGRLTGIIDNRLLVASGFVLMGISAFWMSGLTLDISKWSLLWPIILSGSAAGLVFVPLSTISLGTLPNEQIGNATGLYNLLRNIGGGIGISVIDTVLARHQQLHRAEMSRYITHSPLVDQTLRQLQGVFSLHNGPRLAQLRSYALLNRSLDQQAAVYSYVDDLRYMALVCAVCIPIVFLLRRVRARKGAVVAAH